MFPAILWVAQKVQLIKAYPGRVNLKSERRNGDRHHPSLHLEGEFTLLVGARSVEVRKVRDVSPFGVGLSIDEHVDTESKVTLQHRCGDIETTVQGTVVWSEAESNEEEGGGFRVGVYLHENDITSNVAFFNTISASGTKTFTA